MEVVELPLGCVAVAAGGPTGERRCGPDWTAGMVSP